MLDHVSIPVSSLERASRFYGPTLAPLGIVPRRALPHAVAYGPPERPAPVFWLLVSAGESSARPGTGLHLSFQAPDRRAVDAFHRIALANGGRCAGPPGPRPEYTQPFYGAFVLDLDGYKVEAVCRVAP